VSLSKGVLRKLAFRTLFSIHRRRKEIYYSGGLTFVVNYLSTINSLNNDKCFLLPDESIVQVSEGLFWRVAQQVMPLVPQPVKKIIKGNAEKSYFEETFVNK
jgi:hypothetical protein